MRTRIVTIAAGSGFTAIYASGPFHYMSIQEDDDPTHDLEVKRLDDPTPFATTFLYKENTPIEIFGLGKSGNVGLGPDAFRSGVPNSTGTKVFEVRDALGSEIQVRVTEIEQLG